MLRILIGLFLISQFLIAWIDIHTLTDLLISGKLSSEDLAYAVRQNQVLIVLSAKAVFIGVALFAFGWIRARINRVHLAVYGVPHPALVSWWGL